jgi:hypothetical protein
MNDLQNAFSYVTSDIGDIYGELDTLENTVSNQGYAISNLEFEVDGIEYGETAIWNYIYANCY